jgi:hypothetical protein
MFRPGYKGNMLGYKGLCLRVLGLNQGSQGLLAVLAHMVCVPVCTYLLRKDTFYGRSGHLCNIPLL